MRDQSFFSIKSAINKTFIILLITSIILIDVIIFLAWNHSNNLVLSQLQDNTENEITSEIDVNLEKSIHIIAFGKQLIEKSIIDLDEPNQRNPYFVSSLSQAPDYVYSYSFGSVEGNYYGARRNDANNIEIMLADATTKGHSVYYSTTYDYNIDQEIIVNNEFDPRTRAWYQLAVEKATTVFSPIYKHFIIDDLTVSVATPIYSNNGNLQGVLGAHIVLGNLNDILNKATDYNSNNSTISKANVDTSIVAYVINSTTGEVVANSFNEPNYLESDNGYERLLFTDMLDSNISEIYSTYLKTGERDYTLGQLINKQFVRIIPYENSGLSWNIVLVTKQQPIAITMIRVLVITIIAVFLGLFISIIIWNRIINKLMQPIIDLTKTTSEFRKGNYDVRAKPTQNNEIGLLVNSFNEMASDLSDQVNLLEKEVERRTHELEVSYEDLKKTQEKVTYLSYHDQLTNLYNRRYLEDFLKRIDNVHNIPISIIMIDMNGLKLINDAFGHTLGDYYLKELSSILQRVLRSSDIAARYGGDEFIVVLPNTPPSTVLNIMSRIQESIHDYDYEIVPLSISLGSETKTKSEESIHDIINMADEKMYKHKLMTRDEYKAKTLEHIIEHIKDSYPLEYRHSEKVRLLSHQLGQARGLDSDELEDLDSSAFLHDIGKISISRNILEKKDALDDDEVSLLHQHPEIGYRILNANADTIKLSNSILYHHENWDGSGYPSGLSRENIPLHSRIIRIAESFASMTDDTPYSSKISNSEALEEIQKNKGKIYDPTLVDTFLNIME